MFLLTKSLFFIKININITIYNLNMPEGPVREPRQQEQGMGFEQIHQTPGQPFEYSKAVNVPKGLTIKGFEAKAKKDTAELAKNLGNFSAKKAEAQARMDMEREAKVAAEKAKREQERIERLKEEEAQVEEDAVQAQIEEGRETGNYVQSEIDLRRDEIDESDPDIIAKRKEAKQLYELLHPAFTVNVRHEILNNEVPDPMTMYSPDFQERVFGRLGEISKDLRISGAVLAQAVEIAQDRTLYNVMEFIGDDDSNEATNIRRMILKRVPYEWRFHSDMLNYLKGIHSENAWNIRESIFNALEYNKRSKDYSDSVIGRKLLENIEGDDSERAQKFREQLKGYEKAAVA